MIKTLVVNAVGLTPRLIGEHTPRLADFLRRGKLATITPVIPAVTCTAQATYLSGTWPSEHGIVANGWYFRDECEIKFWRQSGHLVQRPRIWDLARQRDPAFTCANVCWWYAMYSGADYTVTPRPMYLADGRKLPDVWTNPPELRDQLQGEVGQFPLFKFWGPATDISSTQWIADAVIRIDERFNPTLTLVYLPHLDYVLQRQGPHAGAAAPDLRALDDAIGKLIDRFANQGARVIILSEYGITPVARPVHLNRVLRERGLLSVREEESRELLDPGASKAFAVADHQAAHIYVNDASRLADVKQILERTEGVSRVLDDAAKRELHLDHPRSGELICLAEPDAWFTYYYWLDDAKAPDFARTVDIHRKPGYDPVELFLGASKLNVAAKLFKRKLGFRTLLNVIPLDATLVKGSHGLSPRDPADGPLLMSSDASTLTAESLQPTEVLDVLLRHVFG